MTGRNYIVWTTDEGDVPLSQLLAGWSGGGFAPSTTVSGSFNVTSSATTYFVNTTIEAATGTLPALPSTDQVAVFKDSNGNAEANPITIQGNGNTIDGETTWTIETDYGFGVLMWNGAQWNEV